MTYEEILTLGAALLNDTERAVYTDTVMLPYLNIARMELEEIFELNNIPTTNETSAVIIVPDGIDEIGFSTTPPLPANLVEIQRLWESQTGQDNFFPVTKKDFLTSSILGNTERSFFGVWSWQDQKIKVLEAIVDIDLKLDYIKSLFTMLAISELGEENSIVNTSSYFQFRTPALCAEFIMGNTTRAESLNSNAFAALDRSLGISVKGKQSIYTRRMPFRSAYKRRRILA